ncbi:Hsp20/alpha crystallin family protein [bacterium]|nr:MAG: Hsp20/alpha crystallin family protein [bacterium]
MKRKRDFIWDTGWSLTRFSRLVHQVSGKIPSAPEWAGETTHPPMDIFEDEAGVHIQLEVPGMSRDDLNIRLDRDRLSIEGFKQSGGDSQCLRYICVEREFGIFRRIVEVPVSVDASGVRAALVDGVLRIILPKVTERRRAVVDVPIDD